MPADLEALVFDGQDDVSTSYSLRLKARIGVPAPDYLVLQFINYNERIDNGAGTFPLDSAPNDNFGTCAECVALWVDQADISKPPGKLLFQTSGRIVLTVDPRTRRLIGQLEDVRFREIALDPETLSSVFVADGDCAELTAPLTFDLIFVPPEWTCGAASYYTNDGCDCGATDPDCYRKDGEAWTEGLRKDGEAWTEGLRKDGAAWTEGLRKDGAAWTEGLGCEEAPRGQSCQAHQRERSIASASNGGRRTAIASAWPSPQVPSSTQ